ncbi:hypothetical protein [Zongyangia hominis]|uniref:Uncharacterized protein n=1 Tax=Zongyangia hominis TaxID=2763677 RepID=A0A926EFR5_9FIRM|nr:hypothetical protein [Zongyangia hominis]MBC8570867.1 hypothetical protein [Zongyangia hominis]
MDQKAMNAWKHFEQTGSVADYMRYRQLINNRDTGAAGYDPLGGEDGPNADYDRWTGDQTKIY